MKALSEWKRLLCNSIAEQQYSMKPIGIINKKEKQNKLKTQN